MNVCCTCVCSCSGDWWCSWSTKDAHWSSTARSNVTRSQVLRLTAAPCCSFSFCSSTVLTTVIVVTKTATFKIYNLAAAGITVTALFVCSSYLPAFLLFTSLDGCSCMEQSSNQCHYSNFSGFLQKTTKNIFLHKVVPRILVCVPCPRSTFAHATLICTFLTIVTSTPLVWPLVRQVGPGSAFRTMFH